MTLAILFRRLGPYHRARLEAAGRRGALWGIEGGGVDKVYAWDRVTGSESFRRLTLFPDADSGALPPRVVARAVWRALDQVQPTVVAIPGWQDQLALAALRWATGRSVPVVMMSDSHELAGQRAGLKEWVKRRMVCLCSAGLVAGTAAADYLARLGMPQERIFKGYDVVDNEFFKGNAEKLKSETLKGEGGEHCSNAEKLKSETLKSESGEGGERSRLNLPERYFLCVARFIPEKNLPRLVEAYAIYKRKAETLKTETLKTEIWSLVLLGDGPLRQELEHRISDLGLRALVHLPGFRQYEELPAYYGLASAVVLPSVSETWGLTVNEAMACGLPVLVSNRCGCAPDLVREGVNGFTFDPLNPGQLADLMLRVSAPDFPLAEFGEAGRRLIADWGLERFAVNLWRAAQTAVAQPRPRPKLVDNLLVGALLNLRP